ncbi:unnamed protein product [Protopolystoma xenopodis]|uniref:Uncharacterized protein n=1 Tax=Protopolystoma xenopodis TaxID=117903 RepID=A0A3S5BTJ4_9PLAT|nr:unnamed protein product [Protopolystoma xenopodis]
MTRIVSERQLGANDFKSYYQHLCLLNSLVPLQIIERFLDIDFLNIDGDYVKKLRSVEWGPILDSIKINKSLKCIRITSVATVTKILCSALRCASNITTLNLAKCDIRGDGILPLCELVKGIIRHNEAWKQSLRYCHPELDHLRGIGRICLIDNPELGDSAAILLAEIMIDDIWVKAIDLQNCGLSDISAKAWISVLIGFDINDLENFDARYENKETLKKTGGNKTLVVLDLHRKLLRDVTESVLLNGKGRQTDCDLGKTTDSRYMKAMTSIIFVTAKLTANLV